jgi:hypothetical protein
MDPELNKRLDAIEQKVEMAYASAEKTRKYFLVTLVVSAIAFFLPLVGLVFAIPSFLSTYSDISEISGL